MQPLRQKDTAGRLYLGEERRNSNLQKFTLARIAVIQGKDQYQTWIFKIWSGWEK